MGDRCDDRHTRLAQCLPLLPIRQEAKVGAAAVALAEAAVVPLSEISHEVARDERTLAAVSARTAARRAGATKGLRRVITDLL